jgi:hypothetical protein
MGWIGRIQAAGFSREEAEYLAGHDYFKHKTKTAEELLAVFQKIADVYDCEIEFVKKAVMKWPQFAGYDHERVVREATAVYGDEEGVKRAVMKFPPFAYLDHERVLRQKTVVFEAVGLSKEKIIEIILNRPSLASYSAVRDIAGLDVGKELKGEGFQPDDKMLSAYLSFIGKSPYVPGTKRLRIGKARRNSSVVYREPPLLKAMRKRLTRV